MHSLKRSSASFSWLMKNYIRRSLSSESKTELPATDAIKEKNVQVSKLGSVTLIAINRPEKKNSLDAETAKQLSEALDEFENDEKAVSGVLHGTAGNFCSGYDLTELANFDGSNVDSVAHFGPLSARKSLSSKPLIAALNGYAVGVGFELALMCDMRVIEETAVLGFLNRRFGIPVLCGGTVRLPAMIGYSRAMELILTGRAITAEEAFQWGLANRCVPCGAAIGQAITYAQSLVKFPQRSLLADRTSLHFATFAAKEMDEALQFEKDNATHLLFEEGVEGAKKFVEEGIGKHGKFHNITKVDHSIRELDKSLL